MESNFSRWMKKVRDTQDQEIDCATCLEHVSRFVDIQLATGQAAQAMPLVAHHLHQCAVCREEYEVISELARLEAQDGLPSQEELIAQLKRP